MFFQTFSSRPLVLRMACSTIARATRSRFFSGRADCHAAFSIIAHFAQGKRNPDGLPRSSSSTSSIPWFNRSRIALVEIPWSPVTRTSERSSGSIVVFPLFSFSCTGGSIAISPFSFRIRLP